jgi:hypothetical protein
VDRAQAGTRQRRSTYWFLSFSHLLQAAVPRRAGRDVVVRPRRQQPVCSALVVSLAPEERGPGEDAVRWARRRCGRVHITSYQQNSLSEYCLRYSVLCTCNFDQGNLTFPYCIVLPVLLFLRQLTKKRKKPSKKAYFSTELFFYLHGPHKNGVFNYFGSL